MPLGSSEVPARPVWRVCYVNRLETTVESRDADVPSFIFVIQGLHRHGQPTRRAQPFLAKSSPPRGTWRQWCQVRGQEASLHGGQGTDMVPLRILNVLSFPSLLPTHSHPAAKEETKLWVSLHMGGYIFFLWTHTDISLSSNFEFCNLKSGGK